MQELDLPVPLHHVMAGVSPRYVKRKEDGWLILPVSVRPPDTVVDHLVFALKYEGVHLLTLKFAFNAIDKRELERALKTRPTSGYIRRLCFLYEWLTERVLNVPDTTGGAYLDAIDTKQQYAAPLASNNKRFRVRDNLPGTSAFCPLVSRTHLLDGYIQRNLSQAARKILADAPKELIARAAAFLLLSDSKASFEIEGETPAKDRIARWGNVIGKAGRLQLDIEALVGLQRELIGDQRFVRVGLRKKGGFVGRHDALGQPQPEHVSAKPKDLPNLLRGLIDFDFFSGKKSFEPVLAAASISFGFVYIHPFEDGNGRIHRFLMHHVLAERGYTPEEIVFPISSAILDDVARYKDVLEGASRPLLDWVSWRATDSGNVVVENDTADYYRFFDATAHSEYLFKCIVSAVEKDLPNELAFLEHRDKFHRRVTNLVDMPERTLDLLLKFLRQGHGTLSGRARAREFKALAASEARQIEIIFRRIFR